MPLKLIPPGKRKGYPFFIVRGRFLGIDVEKKTRTTDRVAAERFRAAIERRILDSGVPGPEATVGWHKAIDLYVVAKAVSRREEARANKLKTAMIDKPIRSVLQADIDTAARALHPNDTPETRNRNVYTPAAAVLHYAARNQWCAWQRIDRPKQKQPETRAARDGVAEALLSATTGKQRLLVLWLFKHGTRISGALSVDCERIDLQARTYELYITKNRTWQTFSIDDEVWEMLANDPDVQVGRGKLFPWKTRWRVYDWLTPLREQLTIQFTPHMARHWLGKKLNGGGAGLRTIMGALGQQNYKSAVRYVSEDIEVIREATRALGRISGRKKSTG